MTNLETLTLVSRVVALGDEKAYEQIVRAYEPQLRNWLLQQTEGNESEVDDLMQETFIRAWENLNSFRQVAQFKTWLYSIAYNLWMDNRRREAHWIANEGLDTVADTLVDEPDEAEARARWLRQSLRQMPEPTQTILRLFYMQDMSTREIARIMAMSEDSVRQHLSRGRKRLKQVLELTPCGAN